ncbi:MAG: DHHW family protein [Oscillospiraceae bacterium]
MEKIKKARNIILVSVFLIFIFGFAIAGIIQKDRNFSEMENRNLAEFPKLSFDTLKSGDFTSGFEKYMSDHIFLKDQLVTLKTDSDRLILKNYQNGVYFGKDNYYLQRYTENKTQIDKNIGYINDFAKKVDVPIKFIASPNSVCVNSDKLPKNAVNDNQLDSLNYINDNLADNIQFFNAYDCLKAESEKGTQVFYKTDHHWTAYGARTAFENAFADEQILADNNYDGTIKRNDFYGTLYSKAPSSFAKPDEMLIPMRKDSKYSVKYQKENKSSQSLIDRSFLDKKDKYAAFLGGNYAKVDIHSDNAAEQKKIVLLKDSYANAMLPYLADQFSDIIVIDMRYYHFEKQTVSELIKSENADSVVMLYNMDFINSDDNFIWLS